MNLTITKARISDQSSLYESINIFKDMHLELMQELKPFIDINQCSFLASKELGKKNGNAHWQCWFAYPNGLIFNSKDIRNVSTKLKKKYNVTGPQNSHSFFKFIEEDAPVDSLSYPLKDITDPESSDVYSWNIPKEDYQSLLINQKHVNVSGKYAPKKKVSTYRDLIDKFALTYPEFVFGNDNLIVTFLCKYYRISEKYFRWENFTAQRNSIYNELCPEQWEGFCQYKMKRNNKDFYDYLEFINKL